ncbi:MAG: HalX domain-containing protein [Salinivirgaceae bacterium]|nr:HalX domain-containing protein [Salinivirgaceae bacterium]
MDDKNQKVDVPMEQKLKNLYDLQQIQTEINKIKSLRGELPLEVQDLEDELAGLQTRIANLKAEVKEDEQGISNEKHKIAQCQEDIKKYQSQQDNVRNNREYDSLSKEIEFQTLEIELSEKHIREFTADMEHKKEIITSAETKYEERNGDLKQKRSELDSIISETQKKEDELNVKKAEIESLIEERYLTAFNRISSNVRNGLAVVTVQRDACGGCFNKIPPQRQVDIRSRKRIIVCEYCGRILVDSGLAEL